VGGCCGNDCGFGFVVGARGPGAVFVRERHLHSFDFGTAAIVALAFGCNAIAAWRKAPASEKRARYINDDGDRSFIFLAANVRGGAACFAGRFALRREWRCCGLRERFCAWDWLPRLDRDSGAVACRDFIARTV